MSVLRQVFSIMIASFGAYVMGYLINFFSCRFIPWVSCPCSQQLLITFAPQVVFLIIFIIKRKSFSFNVLWIIFFTIAPLLLMVLYQLITKGGVDPFYFGISTC